MTDPLAYIEAAHKHAEQTAQAAGGDDWTTQTHPSDHIAVYDSHRDPVVYDESRPSEAQMVHIAANSPAAVLRRIGGERKLLARHSDNGYGNCSECSQGYECTDWGPTAPCDTVRDLAEGWGWTGGTT
jgi:hypothetical protein